MSAKQSGKSCLPKMQKKLLQERFDCSAERDLCLGYTQDLYPAAQEAVVCLMTEVIRFTRQYPVVGMQLRIGYRRAEIRDWGYLEDEFDIWLRHKNRKEQEQMMLDMAQEHGLAQWFRICAVRDSSIFFLREDWELLARIEPREGEKPKWERLDKALAAWKRKGAHMYLPRSDGLPHFLVQEMNGGSVYAQ